MKKIILTVAINAEIPDDVDVNEVYLDMGRKDFRFGCQNHAVLENAKAIDFTTIDAEVISEEND